MKPFFSKQCKDEIYTMFLTRLVNITLSCNISPPAVMPTKLPKSQGLLEIIYVVNNDFQYCISDKNKAPPHNI